MGEVVALDGRVATVQVYEGTDGLAPARRFYGSGAPLTAELGPGLLDTVFDGIQRPLERLAAAEGDFLGRGARAPALDRDALWRFTPRVSSGENGGGRPRARRRAGDAGHRASGARAGRRVRARGRDRGRGAARRGCRGARSRGTAGAGCRDDVARPGASRPGPFRAQAPLNVPLITGQRVLDTFFPSPRGGAAGMPGGFGTGKTVMQQQLCKWADADVIVYVGCGERGNEMTDVLSRSARALTDPRTGRPLSERTVLIANTSNMPVAAREASIYTGVTIAEYYRDMGYHVAVLADSTSRWAEALREISGRLEEMPAEEGYPSYLATRLAGVLRARRAA